MVHDVINFNIRTAAAFFNAQVASKINLFGNAMFFQKLLDIFQVALFAFRKTGTAQADSDFMIPVFCFYRS